MTRWMLLRKYIVESFKQWVTIAFLLIEAAAFIAEAVFGLPVPRAVYWIVAAVGLVGAGLQMYLNQERRIETLADELQQVRERIPDIRLGFMGEDVIVTELEITVPTYPEPPDIESLTKQQEEELAYEPPKYKSIGDIRINIMGWPTEKQLEEYTKDVAKHLTKYREYLESKYVYNLFWCKAYPIRLAAENTGNCPATDVLIVLHVPDELLVPHTCDLLTEPEPPKKPKLRTLLDALDVTRISMPYLGTHLTRPNSWDIHLGADEDDFTGPFIEPEESTKVSYKVAKLMHNIPKKDFEPFYVVVPGERVNRDFDVAYEIHANQLPYPLKGRLKLEVRYIIDSEEV